MRVHLPYLLVLFLLFSACGGREGRVIPEKEMAELYADMFFSDQWLKENADAKRAADTTLFFDPIFARHGFTFADYERSIEFYSGEPEVLSRIVDSASAALKRQAERYSKISTAIRKAKEEEEKNRAGYTAVDFSADSAVWAAKDIFWPAKDSVDMRPDSLEAGELLRVKEKPEASEVGRPQFERAGKTLERVEMKDIKLR